MVIIMEIIKRNKLQKAIAIITMVSQQWLPW